MSDVTVHRDERGVWCVLLNGRVLSSHASRNAAATSANQIIAANAELAALDPDEVAR